MTPKQSELVRTDMGAIRRALGLKRGGAEALGALALLTGGDYDTEGLKDVGRVGAMRIISYLLRGCEVCVPCFCNWVCVWELVCVYGRAGERGRRVCVRD